MAGPPPAALFTICVATNAADDARNLSALERNLDKVAQLDRELAKYAPRNKQRRCVLWSVDMRASDAAPPQDDERGQFLRVLEKYMDELHCEVTSHVGWELRGAFLLVYISCHGVATRGADNERYLLLPHGYVRAAAVEDMVCRSGFGRSALVLDCCEVGAAPLCASQLRWLYDTRKLHVNIAATQAGTNARTRDGDFAMHMGDVLREFAAERDGGAGVTLSRVYEKLAQRAPGCSCSESHLPLFAMEAMCFDTGAADPDVDVNGRAATLVQLASEWEAHLGDATAAAQSSDHVNAYMRTLGGFSAVRLNVFFRVRFHDIDRGGGERAPTPPPCVHIVPRKPGTFCGRAALLQRVARLIDSTSLLILHGMGGMGKTSLALEATHMAIDTGHFEVVMWLRGDSHHHLQASLQESTRHPDVNVACSDEIERTTEMACDWLRETSKTWLVVVDNVVASDRVLHTLAQMLPRDKQGCTVLLVTRHIDAIPSARNNNDDDNDNRAASRYSGAADNTTTNTNTNTTTNTTTTNNTDNDDDDDDHDDSSSAAWADVPRETVEVGPMDNADAMALAAHILELGDASRLDPAIGGVIAALGGVPIWVTLAAKYFARGGHDASMDAAASSESWGRWLWERTMDDLCASEGDAYVEVLRDVALRLSVLACDVFPQDRVFQLLVDQGLHQNMSRLNVVKELVKRSIAIADCSGKMVSMHAVTQRMVRNAMPDRMPHATREVAAGILEMWPRFCVLASPASVSERALVNTLLPHVLHLYERTGVECPLSAEVRRDLMLCCVVGLFFQGSLQRGEVLLFRWLEQLYRTQAVAESTALALPVLEVYDNIVWSLVGCTLTCTAEDFHNTLHAFAPHMAEPAAILLARWGLWAGSGRDGEPCQRATEALAQFRPTTPHDLHWREYVHLLILNHTQPRSDDEDDELMRRCRELERACRAACEPLGAWAGDALGSPNARKRTLWERVMLLLGKVCYRRRRVNELAEVSEQLGVAAEKMVPGVTYQRVLYRTANLYFYQHASLAKMQLQLHGTDPRPNLTRARQLLRAMLDVRVSVLGVDHVLSHSTASRLGGLLCDFAPMAVEPLAMVEASARAMQEMTGAGNLHYSAFRLLQRLVVAAVARQPQGFRAGEHATLMWLYRLAWEARGTANHRPELTRLLVPLVIEVVARPAAADASVLSHMARGVLAASARHHVWHVQGRNDFDATAYSRMLSVLQWVLPAACRECHAEIARTLAHLPTLSPLTQIDAFEGRIAAV